MEKEEECIYGDQFANLDAHIAEWYLWNRTVLDYFQVGRCIVVEEQK